MQDGSHVKIEQLLDAIDLVEYPLLKWGIVDSSLTAAEFESVIVSVVGNEDAESFKKLLLDRGLVFETPYGTYRSRIAEFIRLTLRLRQWFPGKKSYSGKLLVHDIKYHLRPRSFPKRELTSEKTIDSLIQRGYCRDGDLLRAVFPQKISRFQERAIFGISDSLFSGRNESFVVAAGTGSGKTNAYFLPLLNWLSLEMETNGRLGVRSLALYPRNELLKDQLSNALGQTRQLNAKLRKKSAPTIRLGVWFQDSPYSLSNIKSGHLANWTKIKVEGKTAFRCPFLRCLECHHAGDLVLFEDDIQRGLSTLRCQNKECDFNVASDELVFERRSLSAKHGGCEVLFTTTESLNRQMGTEYGDVAFGLSASSNLRSILVDEAHLYDGLTGAQNAYLFRRVRYRIGRDLTWVSLSATLDNPSAFIGDLIGLNSLVVEPEDGELDFCGADYVVAVRHYLESRTSPLSTAIQLAMLMSRTLDPLKQDSKSGGLFGSKLFVFGDKHDVVNRFYASLADAEGNPGPRRGHRSPASLATLRSENQSGLPEESRESGISRYDDGQWWKMSEELGHSFASASGKKVGITSSQQRGVNRDADIIVATGSLEVGYDDTTVGAVLQYKVPKASASFLQRKGRAGRTQAMRPFTAMVLSPFGSDRAAWSNAENQIFLPRLPERRLPLANRYTRKMQATYALLDWLHSSAGSKHSWNLLSEKFHRPELLANSINVLTRLIEDAEYQREFSSYVSNCLGLHDSETDQILWSQPRGILSVVVPTALRRLEVSFTEDGVGDSAPLKEFISSSLFSELYSQDVEVKFPRSESGTEYLPIERALREFCPGNVSRHFGERYWIPINSEQRSIDISQMYEAVEVGYLLQVNNEDLSLYRPKSLKLVATPDSINDSTTTFGAWDVSFNCVGDPLSISLGITAWGEQRILLDAYLHSRGSNLLVYRFMDKTEGWTSKRVGNPERIDAYFVVGEKKVAIGFDSAVDGLHIKLKKPAKHPEVSNRERTDWLENLLKSDSRLSAIANVFDLERIARGLILLRLKYKTFDQVLGLSDLEFMHELIESAKSVQLDLHVEVPHNEFEWLSLDEVSVIKHIFSRVNCERDTEWTDWLDTRIMNSLAALFIETFRVLIPEIDFDDLIIDVTKSSHDTSTISVWISETSSGGNGSIQRIADELQGHSDFNYLVQSLLKPQEFEKLDDEIRSLINFAREEGSVFAAEIRGSWTKGLAITESAINSFFRAVESQQMFPSNSARAVFVNRFLGPGCNSQITDLALQLASKWDDDEKQSGFTLSPEIVGLRFKDNDAYDGALHLQNPTPARRASAITGIAWLRKEQGVDMDFEISNPYSPRTNLDLATLRKMVYAKSDVSPQLEEVESKTWLIGENDFIQVSGSPEAIRREIINAVLDPVEDDAIWIYRRVSEVVADGQELSARLRSDSNRL